MAYAGADWMQAQLDALHKMSPKKNPEKKLSTLGVKVADFLGEWQRGIYHLHQRELLRADWTNAFYIQLSIFCVGMSTYDFDDLTRLVFLAHDMSLRVEIAPSTRNYMRLTFHERTHGDSANGMLWHPTLEEAVTLYRQTHVQTENEI